MWTPMDLVDRIESDIGLWVIRYRMLIVLVAIIVVLLSAMGLKDVKMSAGYRPLFNANDENLVAFDDLENEFTKLTNALILVRSKDNTSLFTPRMLGFIKELTERSWTLPHSQRVDSITNFQHTEADGDDLLVRDLVEDPVGLAPAQLSEIKRIALTEPTLRGKLIAEQGNVAGINITFNVPPATAEDPTPEARLFGSTRKLVGEMQEKYPDITIYLTGRLGLDNAFYEVALLDAETVVPLSLVLMLFIFLVLSRSVIGTLLTSIVIISSIVVAVGVVAFNGIIFHTGNAMAPTIILTIASASCVHLLMSYTHYRNLHGNNKEAVVESLRINFQPVTLTCITTALGFMTILLSDIPAFRVLSVLVTLGIGASLFLVILLLPALLSYLPDKKMHPVPSGKDEFGTTLMGRLGELVANHSRPLLYGMLTLVIFTMTGIPKNKLNDNWVGYFDESLAFRQASDFAANNMAGIYTLQFSLDSGSPGGVNDPLFLEEVDKLGQWLISQPEVRHVSSIVDTYKRLNKNMHGDDPAAYRLPSSRNEAAQYLLLYELSLPYGLDITNQVNLDKSKTRLVVSIDTLDSKGMIALDKRITGWANDNTTYFKEIAAIGPDIAFSYKSQSNGRQMLVTTSIALIGISGLLILMLRSVKIGLISLIPNLIPAAMGFGIWGYLDGEITLSLSLVMTMTLGIVIDDTIHFLSKYQRARQEKNMPPKVAVIYSFKTVGQALITTSVMLAGGFFVLMQSHFLLNAEMGFLTGIIILAALLADFFLLPPLMIKLDKR